MPVEIVDRLGHELAQETARVSADVDRFFGDLLKPPGDSRDRLYEAMRHAAIGGGKRLRPLLTTRRGTVVRDRRRPRAPRWPARSRRSTSIR